jgi:hypothetical protein
MGIAAAPLPIIRTVTKQFPVPACKLSAEDIRRLHRLLNDSAQRVIDVNVKTLQNRGLAADQFTQFQNLARETLRSWMVETRFASGESALGMHVLSDESLPDNLVRVTFDSVQLFRNLTGSQQHPANAFSIVLDFSRVQLLDTSNPSQGPTPNQSFVTVWGNDTTWVDGLHSQLKAFFGERATSVDWLHTHITYDVFLFLLLPSSFAWVYRINLWIEHAQIAAPQALLVSFYVYVVLVILYFYRLAFNYARWIFPKIEGPRAVRKLIRHRAALVAVIGTLLGPAFYDLIKWLWTRL